MYRGGEGEAGDYGPRRRRGARRRRGGSDAHLGVQGRGEGGQSARKVYKGSPLQAREGSGAPEVTLEALLHDRPKGMREFLCGFIEGHDTFEQTDLDFWTAVRDYRREVKSYAESADDVCDAVMFAPEGAAEMVEQFVDLDRLTPSSWTRRRETRSSAASTSFRRSWTETTPTAWTRTTWTRRAEPLRRVRRRARRTSERLRGPEMRLSRELEEAARFSPGARSSSTTDRV